MNDQEPILTMLNLEYPVWEQVFTVHPLVIVGSIDKDDSANFAPKHMVFPLGWKNYFGFVCTPDHATYQNIKRTGEFTVTYPRPDQVVLTSITASPRCDDNTKPELDSIEKISASVIDGYFIKEGYLYLECKLLKFVDGFGENSLILGEIVAARAWSDVIRSPSHDDNESIYEHPQLAYISPGRFAVIDETQAFPFPTNFKK
jgi:flavin reductase (DIM6/NTAB) family NADH-FMN oxidoreductase RutF